MKPPHVRDGTPWDYKRYSKIPKLLRCIMGPAEEKNTKYTYTYFFVLSCRWRRPSARACRPAPSRTDITLRFRIHTALARDFECVDLKPRNFESCLSCIDCCVSPLLSPPVLCCRLGLSIMPVRLHLIPHPHVYTPLQVRRELEGLREAVRAAENGREEAEAGLERLKDKKKRDLQVLYYNIGTCMYSSSIRQYILGRGSG